MGLHLPSPEFGDEEQNDCVEFESADEHIQHEQPFPYDWNAVEICKWTNTIETGTDVVQTSSDSRNRRNQIDSKH